MISIRYEPRLLKRLFNGDVETVGILSETKIGSKVYAFLLIKGVSQTNSIRILQLPEFEIAKAKTRVILWEITDRGYTLMNRARPKWKSKGDYKHKFCSSRLQTLRRLQRRSGYEQVVDKS